MANFRRPRIQLQLREPVTGRFDCGAYSGAMNGDAHSKGALVFTGRQVRLATDEPIPDRLSPGLNQRQVDEALYKLSKGAIDVDTRYNAPWTLAESFLRAGKWLHVSVIRQVLVDHGNRGGNSFGGAHGVLLGFDQVLREFVLADPLVAFWQVTTSAIVRQAAAEFLTRNGVGAPAGFYGSFSRDVWTPTGAIVAPPSYSIRFEGDVSFFAYRVGADLRIDPVRETIRFEHDTSAPSSAPRQYYYPAIHANRRLVRITRGTLAGKYVQPGASGVKLVEAAA